MELAALLLRRGRHCTQHKSATARVSALRVHERRAALSSQRSHACNLAQVVTWVAMDVQRHVRRNSACAGSSEVETVGECTHDSAPWLYLSGLADESREGSALGLNRTTHARTSLVVELEAHPVLSRRRREETCGRSERAGERITRFSHTASSSSKEEKDEEVLSGTSSVVDLSVSRELTPVTLLLCLALVQHRRIRMEHLPRRKDYRTQVGSFGPTINWRSVRRRPQ